MVENSNRIWTFLAVHAVRSWREYKGLKHGLHRNRRAQGRHTRMLRYPLALRLFRAQVFTSVVPSYQRQQFRRDGGMAGLEVVATDE